jgi:hypothetical protein
MNAFGRTGFLEEKSGMPRGDFFFIGVGVGWSGCLRTLAPKAFLALVSKLFLSVRCTSVGSHMTLEQGS